MLNSVTWALGFLLYALSPISDVGGQVTSTGCVLLGCILDDVFGALVGGLLVTRDHDRLNRTPLLVAVRQGEASLDALILEPA